MALCVLALLTVGVVMVNSADMSVGAGGAVTAESILLSRSTLYMALAVGAMWLCAVLPIRAVCARIERNAEPPSSPTPRLSGSRGLWLGVGVLSALLLTVYLPVIGHEVNGAYRWVRFNTPGLGETSMQPSELAKWGLVLLIAWYAVTRAEGLRRFWTGLLPALVATAIVAGIIVVEDLGTGVVVGAVACVMLVAAGARIRHFLPFLPVAGAAIVAAILVSPYRVRRLTAFLDPYADPQWTGYHMIQSMVAVANGEIFGRGLGHGLQKFGYLPEDRTDFLFAVICEEMGIAGAMLVIGLYTLLLWAGIAIIRAEPSRLLRMIGLGILVTIGLQAAVNLAVVTGLGPTKGIALPLLSSGGTGWVLTAACLGLLVNMDRTRRKDRVEQARWQEGRENRDGPLGHETGPTACPH